MSEPPLDIIPDFPSGYFLQLSKLATQLSVYKHLSSIVTENISQYPRETAILHFTQLENQRQDIKTTVIEFKNMFQFSFAANNMPTGFIFYIDFPDGVTNDYH